MDCCRNGLRCPNEIFASGSESVEHTHRPGLARASGRLGTGLSRYGPVLRPSPRGGGGVAVLDGAGGVSQERTGRRERCVQVGFFTALCSSA